ncbi:hypothetical protein [Microvirga sp. VF16]|uniref:hypothetical protein n=1 Tax=Microvirga sp. VF16 TaxID=2807101 RepID=UPI00193E2ECC|nr:hypothetical protein [Microvirga sp. VF16]QRM28717.1 hypothetical protein JO965_21225 [Microvirga sp. VF16]
MKDAATAPEIADPYATLEQILKVIGRTWLSEEWRLEDVRLLAQEAIATRDIGVSGESGRTAVSSLQTQIRFKASIRQVPAKRSGRLSS